MKFFECTIFLRFLFRLSSEIISLPEKALNEHRITTHEDVNIPESDGAVGDEGCVEGVKVGDGLHVRDEDGDAEEEHDQDDPDHAWVEPLVVMVLLLQPHLQLHQFKSRQGAPPPVHTVLILVVVLRRGAIR